MMANATRDPRHQFAAHCRCRVRGSVDRGRRRPGADQGGELVVRAEFQSAEPRRDGHLVAGFRNINMNIYETLYGFSEDIKPIPILAETLDISDDGLTYRFPLRKGVKFHNGKEMTADDVKASLERYRKVGATGNLLDPVASIDITGDYEVTLKHEEADADLPRGVLLAARAGRDHPGRGGRRRGRTRRVHRHRPLQVRRICARTAT